MLVRQAHIRVARQTRECFDGGADRRNVRGGQNVPALGLDDKVIYLNKRQSKQSAIIDIAMANKERDVPEYLQVDEKNKRVKFVRVPKFEEVPYPVTMEPNLVIEYYSR